MSGVENVTVYFNVYPKEEFSSLPLEKIVDHKKAKKIHQVIMAKINSWKESHLEWDFPVVWKSLARPWFESRFERSWDDYADQALQRAPKFFVNESRFDDEEDDNEEDEGGEDESEDDDSGDDDSEEDGSEEDDSEENEENDEDDESEGGDENE